MEWFQSRRDNQRAAPHGPAKRFNSQAIAGPKSGRAETVPDNESKHAIEPVHYIVAPTTISFENDFRIRFCSEDSSLLKEQITQFGKIVNLAIENDNIATIVALHGLIAGGKVDNRKPAMSEENIPIAPLATRVRTTMSDCVKGTSRGNNIYDRRVL